MKKILVSGYIGFNNFGDEAIFYVLLNHLKSLNMSVSALCNNKKALRKKYGIKTYKFNNPLEILKAIISCDILISGGGSLLQNKTSNKSLCYYLLIIILAKLFFKKVIIFAQGFDGLEGNFFKFLTKLVLKSCNFVSVRDLESYKLLEEQKINSVLLSDPVYSLIQEIQETEKEDNKKRDALTVQLRNSEGINKEFLEKIALLIEKNYKTKFSSIKVIPFQKEYDMEISLDFIEELKKRNIDNVSLIDIENTENIKNSFDILKNILDKSAYVIAARFHAALISSALQIKTFALSYDNKVKNLAKELNMDHFDLTEENDITEKLENFFSNDYKVQYNYRRFNWDLIDNEL